VSDSITNVGASPDSAIGVAARPAPGIEVGANDVAVPPAVLSALGATPGDVAALTSESATVWATLRSSREADPPRGSAYVLRLGRMLWPQLGVKPGQALSVGRAGELPIATEVRLTPPFNLTFKTHERLLARLRDDHTPLYPGMRVLADVFTGGAGMIVRIDSVTPSPARLGPDTEVELHKADVAVSERQIGLADVGGMEPVVQRLRELVELLLLRLGFQVFKKLFSLLQSLPAFGRFYHEGFACSHGCIAFLKVQGFVFHLKPDTPTLFILHTNSYATKAPNKSGSI